MVPLLGFVRRSAIWHVLIVCGARCRGLYALLGLRYRSEGKSKANSRSLFPADPHAELLARRRMKSMAKRAALHGIEQRRMMTMLQFVVAGRRSSDSEAS